MPPPSDSDVSGTPEKTALGNNDPDASNVPPGLQPRKVVLPPSDVVWTLPEFIRANANVNAKIIAEDARRVHDLCVNNGYPQAKLANVTQHISMMRRKTGRSKHGKPAIVATNHPMVDKFLESARLFAELLPDFSRAIREERENFQARIAQLEDQLSTSNEARESAESQLRHIEEEVQAELEGVVNRVTSLRRLAQK